jgi:hypothetical protein
MKRSSRRVRLERIESKIRLFKCQQMRGLKRREKLSSEMQQRKLKRIEMQGLK